MAKDPLQVIRVFPDAEAVSQAAADHFIEVSVKSIAERGRFAVALSGGSTPKRLYQLLAEPERALRVDWSKVHLFLGDERYVAPTDSRSNEKMVRDTLVSKVTIPPKNLHTIFTQDGWDASAAAYDSKLKAFFGQPGPTFDLALQGMGGDGHTASLFPGGPVYARGVWAATAEGPVDAPERITLTLSCLAVSREILFLVAGPEKSARLREVLKDPLSPAHFPAAALAAAAKNVKWWIDKAAAGNMPIPKSATV